MRPDQEKVLAALAPGGRLRAAINLGNPVLAQTDLNGNPSGISTVLARRLGQHLDLPVDLRAYPSASKVVADCNSGSWDIAFLAVEPQRTDVIAFTQPYIFIDATYLVRYGSPFRSVNDVDRKNVEIIVGGGAAYDLALTRQLKHATIARVPTSARAIKTFIAGESDACAGIRPALVAAVESLSGFRVLPDSFSRIAQAMATPKGRPPEGLQYLTHFIAEMEANGFIRDQLSQSVR